MKDKLHGIFTGTHFKFPNAMKLSIWLRNPFSPGSIWMTALFFSSGCDDPFLLGKLLLN